MLYVKNLPVWERAARLGVGAIAAWAALHFIAGPVGIVAAISAAGIALSGLVGYCPMRAVLTRKLDSSKP